MRASREAGGYRPPARELTVPRTGVSVLSAAAAFRLVPLAPVLDDVIARPWSGSHLGRLTDGDPRTQVSGHERCGGQPCREAGGCRPPSRGLSVLEPCSSVLCLAAVDPPEPLGSGLAQREC